MINVLPKEGESRVSCGLSCPPATIECHSISNGSDLFVALNRCDAQSLIGPISGPDAPVRAEQLEQIKAQLRQALADLDKPPHFDSQFETLDQFEELQQRLRDATVELEERKAKFVKRQASKQ
jgi:hypothetical protein